MRKRSVLSSDSGNPITATEVGIRLLLGRGVMVANVRSNSSLLLRDSLLLTLLASVITIHTKLLYNSATVCYKVSLCENCQRQSCKAFIGLTNRAKMIGGGRPLLLEILSQSDSVGAKFEQ